MIHVLIQFSFSVHNIPTGTEGNDPLLFARQPFPRAESPLPPARACSSLAPARGSLVISLGVTTSKGEHKVPWRIPFSLASSDIQQEKMKLLSNRGKVADSEEACQGFSGNGRPPQGRKTFRLQQEEQRTSLAPTSEGVCVHRSVFKCECL